MDEMQLTFELDPASVSPSAQDTSSPASVKKKKNEAKKSISYVMDAALEFGKVSGFADLLDRVAVLRYTTGYSPFNSLLMLLQRPAATYVLPAHQWHEKYGFVIRPGEQPIVLLQQGGPVMFLLDVSQVEPGEGAVPLPAHLANPYAMADLPEMESALHWMIENAKFDGVRVTPAGLGKGFAGCARPSRSSAVQRITVRKRPEPQEREVRVRFDVELNRSYSVTEQVATLAHELGHVYCGHLGADMEKHWKDRESLDRELRELEAESVARLVFSSLAPGVQLPDHLRQYFAQEPDLVGASLEAVMKAAGRVLDISRGWGPRWKSGDRQPAKTG